MSVKVKKKKARATPSDHLFCNFRDIRRKLILKSKNTANIHILEPVKANFKNIETI